MKTLIETSIVVAGIGPKGSKTIFDIHPPSLESPEQEIVRKTNLNYVPLERMQNRKVSVSFKFEENGQQFDDKIQVTLLGTDEDIKANVISLINLKLAE